MKKSIWMIFAMMMAAVTFSSCSKDDDNEEKPVDNTIYGIWKSDIIKGSESNPDLQYFYMYGKDGMTYTLCVRYDKNGKSLKKPNISIGKFEINGNKLSEWYAGTTEESNFKVENNILTIYTDEWTNEFIRSSEKEVMKHYEDINPKKMLVGAWECNYNPRKNNQGLDYYYYEVYFNNGKSYTLYLFKNYNGESTDFAEVHEATWSFDNYIFKQTFKDGYEYENFISMDKDNLSECWYDNESNELLYLDMKRIDLDEIQQYIDNPDRKYAATRRMSRSIVAKK